MICPFCKEEIRDEAIKCRYCGSSLLPLQPASSAPENASVSGPIASDKQVVYIVDQGLLQFGKFVAGALAIFVVVGIYLYGIDVKESLKLIESSRTEVKQSADAVTALATDVEKTRGTMQGTQEKISGMVSETEKDLETMKAESESIHSSDTETRATAEKVQAIGKRLDEETRRFDADEAQVNEALEQTKQELAQIRAAKDEAIATAHSIKAGTADTEPAAAAPVPTGPGGNEVQAAQTSFTPVELAKLYDFPPGTDGQGQTIGLIELSGGFEPNNLREYFKTLGLQAPKVTAVSVDGAKNNVSTANSADGEVQGDIEVAGAVAPGAEIVVYFTPNTNQGFLDAISTAVHDDAHRLSVLSISWGGPESSWTKLAMQSMNEALMAARQRNITVLAASGDNGTSDGVSDQNPHVDFPASSPWVTAVGGTRLYVSGGRIVSEAVWDEEKANLGASGRGVSAVFPKPAWQNGAHVPATPQGFAGRGLPDVAANASPSSGYLVRIDGQTMVIGGTAMATPLWAGLIARLDQALGRRTGFLNDALYTKIGPASALNGAVAEPEQQGKRDWNERVGWGTPNGRKLLEALR